MKNLLKLFVLVSFPFLFAADVIVDPAQAVIVLSPECGAVAKFAAKDLQEHFKLITGKKIPVVSKAVSGKYPFRFVKTAGLKPEEARWKVGKNETVFTGDDENIPAEKKFHSHSSPVPVPSVLSQIFWNVSSKSAGLHREKMGLFIFLQRY